MTAFRSSVVSAFALSCVACAIVIFGTSSAAATSPFIRVSPDPVSPGQVLAVSGSGLTPRATYSVEICGQRAATSLDCLYQTPAGVITSSLGEFNAQLTVAIPPTPCPCVVAVWSLPYLELRATSPLQIAGVPFSAAVHVKTSHIVVREAEITGPSSLSEQFGSSADRMLVLTVANTGGRAAGSLTAFIAVNGTPQSEPRFLGIAAGGERTYRMPIVVPALSIGSQAVVGQLTTGNGRYTAFSTSTTVFPWGLLIVVLVLIQIVFLALRNIARRRHERNRTDHSTIVTSDDAPTEELTGMGVS